METRQPGQPFVRRKGAPLIKTAAIVLGLIAIGYVAVTVAEHALPHARAAAAPALKSPEMTAGHATALPGSLLSTHVSPASNSRDDQGGRTEGPRECRPDEGFVSECIFN